MPLYNDGDIVKVPFPFTEGMGEKGRPALVVSSKNLAREHRLYWLVMITSVIEPAWAGDVIIADYKSIGLPVLSAIRTAKIATLQEDRILGRIGKLSPRDKKKVQTEIQSWLMK